MSLIYNMLTPTFSTSKSLNLVECYEFRELLLLLRPSLTEANIPRRTKLRELIIHVWKEYFQVLKSQLAVRASLSLSRHVLIFSRLQWDRFLSRWTPGPIKIESLTSR